MNRITVLMAIPLVGCPVVGSDWQPITYVDEGNVCFEEAGEDVTVEVTAPECLSSSCSRNLTGSCAADVSGTDITLTADIMWEQDMGPVACTEDCGSPTVSCSIEGLADGTYDVTFGDQTLTLTLPIEDDCQP